MEPRNKLLVAAPANGHYFLLSGGSTTFLMINIYLLPRFAATEAAGLEKRAAGAGSLPVHLRGDCPMKIL